jgi:cysteine desulfurase
MTANSPIYLDHSATTPLDAKVLKAMQPYLTEIFGNPSSIHGFGQMARSAVDEARRTVAEILFCEPSEIVFTSGGTESDNLALRGVLRNFKNAHLITTAVEHHAILHTAEALRKEGYEITILPVDEYGRVSVAQVEAALQPNTKLISIMLANNEVGSMLPVREIGKMLEKKRERGEVTPLLHTDAVQGGGILNLDTRHLKVDLLSLSAHKFYGPKGIGILYVKNGVKLLPTQTGGGQEKGKRAGTENVAGIVGIAAALKLANDKREKESARLIKLREELVNKILKEIPRSEVTGHATERLPGSASFIFYGVEGESMLLRLDFEGIAASTGSACNSASLQPSHVLTAMQIPHEWKHGSLRLTLGRSTTSAQLQRVAKVLKKIVSDLRAISPVR